MSKHAEEPTIIAADDAAKLLQRLQTPAFPRTAARLLGWAFVLLVVGLLFVPWQQSVAGTGQVVALDPLERPQTIQATIAGIIDEWHVREGSKVKQGDRLVVIRDNDPLLLSRLKDAVTAAQDKLETTQAKMGSYKEQIDFYKTARDLQISITRSQLEIARQKLRGDNNSLMAAEAAKLQAEQKLNRYRQLVAEKLASPQELEIETAYAAKAAADYAKAAAEVEASTREVQVKEDYIRYAESDANAKIVEAQTKLQTAEGEQASAKSSLLKAQSELASFEQQVITAPRDGTIVRLLANAGQKGGQVAQGDALLQFVPDYTKRAVELWVDGNDAPWVTPGRRVRLQFEGWPALQFAAGWPSAALGTFGGEVMLVDAAPNSFGKFRVLIVPSSDPGEADWPGLHVDPKVDVRRELRQGVRCNGWVLLNEVPLGFELWRQLNGFPPSIEPDRFDPYHSQTEEKGDKAKSKPKTKESNLGGEEK
jgi:adhesin transport system membrane fusion protein